ncbi:AAA family ATPase [Polynucleobacter sp. MG-6-Vaara-E2]|uniref:AAA family ATPase n=1 Tax=Polynucleobacter sp. MG-6-Vaara-E2 TaxID=2576932 RepID=UPI001BFEC0F6|nr:AAA family ATPase [Polynucleobacter sp. MG-6-Vaara-E2]QWD96215.1 AAA family ATPase [Polynucleobacter sp. MG-6-Vaara-E2]
MKIAVIASSPAMLALIEGVLEKNPGDDQFVYLLRINEQIHLERIDLFSTNILILDANTVSDADLKAISECTKQHSNPSIFYLCNLHSETALISLMRSGVTEAISLPLIDIDLNSAVGRIRDRSYLSSVYHARGKILAFISCKGGAGATFLATNLGYSLAEDCQQKVLLIDLHMQYGDASYYLTDQMSSITLGDIVKQVGLDSTIIAAAAMKISSNYFLLQAPASPEMSVGIVAQHIDNLLTVAIQDYDFVILDISHTLDALNMRALDRADMIFPVMQPVVPYLRAMTKQLRIFSMLGYPENKIKVVLNRMDSMVNLSEAKMEDSIQKKIFVSVPNDFVSSAESVNTGISILKQSPDSPVSKEIRDLAASLSGKVAKSDNRSLLQKIFGMD